MPLIITGQILCFILVYIFKLCLWIFQTKIDLMVFNCTSYGKVFSFTCLKSKINGNQPHNCWEPYQIYLSVISALSDIYNLDVKSCLTSVCTAVAKETEFEFWGFIFVMLAAVMSGFRWTMTQILLQKEVYGLKNPLTLMSYVTPVMAVATAVLSLIMDPWDEFRTSNYFNSSWHITRSCLLMFLGGTLAFFMVLTEYILVSVTSAVTVTIAGVVKEAVTILVAVFYFHDQFTWLKGVGLITILFGVSLFNWYKYQKLQKGELGEENVARSLTTNPAAKYVILEEMDDQDDGPWELGNHTVESDK